MGLISHLRDRATIARSENTATAIGDAIHFEKAADALEKLRGYAVHSSSCSALRLDYAFKNNPTFCTCGLSELLKEIDGE